jgi:hypothetical protein
MEGIASLLETRRLAVPVYQRSYAWGDEGHRDHVEEFFTDLSGTFVVPNSEYFLGTTVVSGAGAPSSQLVIDGQQRLATTAILIAAIRDELKERGDQDRARIVDEQFLSRMDLRTALKVPQLVLNADDDPFFNRRIIHGDLTAVASRESHRLIESAYATLRARVKSTGDDAASGWSDRLLDWIDFLRDRVRVISVEVPTEADAFLIFETLNDRGADLTIADLLKNYLFGRSGDQLEPVKTRWIQALSNLDIASVGNQHFTDFLRHYWSSKYGATRERELYGKIKARVSTAQNAVDLSDELLTASRLYAALLNSEHEFWSESGASCRDLVEILGILNLEQARPLLLALMQHFPSRELPVALRSMVSWGVRGIIVGGIGGGVYERAYCEAAVDIRSGSIKDVAALRSKLNPIIPGDAQFVERAATAGVTRAALARYLLRAMERQAQGDAEPELVPNTNEQEVNLEHILPKSATDPDWVSFDDDQKFAFLHRLGNLALLAKGPNGRIGNKPFTTKRPILAASRFFLTKAAGQGTNWGPAEVTARGERLAELAKATWPL